MTGPYHQLKSLNQEAVRQMAESLMLLHGFTSTLDVKMALREQGYQAQQMEVSTFMEELAVDLDWYFKSNGTYRIYLLDQEMEDLWNSQQEQHTLAEKARIIGLPLNLYRDYQEYLESLPVWCRLSYFGIRKTERQPAEFLLDDQIAKGYFLLHKDAGYEFCFDWKERATELNNILHTSQWDGIHTNYTSNFLLGERVITEQAFLASGEAMGHYRLRSKASRSLVSYMQVSNSRLYKVDIRFRSGKTLSIDRSQLDLKTELLPLTRKLLRLGK